MRLATSVGISAAIAILLSSLPATVTAENWSGWMGNQRDGVYRETGIVDEVPQDGLKIKWRKPVALGYAGPAADEDHVYVFDYKAESGAVVNDPGQRATLNGKGTFDRVRCGQRRTDLAIRVRLSLQRVLSERTTMHANRRWRSCLHPWCRRRLEVLEDGERRGRLGTKPQTRLCSRRCPIWGFASHPLVDGDLLYTMVGGAGQGIVAFDKLTGEVRWKALDAKTGYCPAVDHLRRRHASVDRVSSHKASSA